MVKDIRRRRKDENQGIARERIGILLGLADKEALEGSLDLASDFIARARTLSMKFNVRIPREYKRRFCRHCHCYLLPGRSSRSRINSRQKRVEVLCLRCGKRMFYPYRREIKARRRPKAGGKGG